MTIRNILAPGQRFTNINGNPLSNGTVEFKDPVTSTAVIAFQDSGFVTAHEAIIVLDGGGYQPIWLNVDADMEVKDKDGNLIGTDLSVNPSEITGVTDSGLVPNGSFEIDDDSNLVPDGWELTGFSGSTNAIDSTESTDGINSFKFTSIGNGGGELVTTDFFVVNDIDVLSVQFDIKSSVVNVRNIVRLEWFDSAKSSISNTDIYDDASANPTSFTSFLLQAIPPANARFAKLRLIGCDSSDATTGTTHFDRIVVFYNLKNRAYRGALVQRNANQIIGASVVTVIILNDVIYDTDNIRSSSRLIVPVGVTRVRLICRMSTVGGTGTRVTEITKNGAAGFVGSASDNQTATAVVYDVVLTTAALTVVAGDYFELTIFQTEVGSINTSAFPWLEMEIIE